MSTPGSPDYRHYLTAAQYAAEFGPSPAEVAQVSSALRAEGLDGRDSGPGQHVAPGERHGRRRLGGVRDAARVGPGTGPGEPRAREHRVTADPGIPRRRGDRRGRPRRSVPGALHAGRGPVPPGSIPGHRRRPRPRRSRAATQAPRPSPCARRHAAGLPRCVSRRRHRGRRLHVDPDGLDLRAEPDARPGAHRHRPDDRRRRVRAVPPERLRPRSSPVTACPTPSATCSSTAAPAGRPPGGGEAALDTELAAVNAPSASLVVYEAPNNNDAAGLRPLQPHRQRRQRPGRHDELGRLRVRHRPPATCQTENGIFAAHGRCRGRP